MHEAGLLPLATVDAAQAWRYSAHVHRIRLWEPAVKFLDAHLKGTASRARARAIAPRTAGHRRAGGSQARRPGDTRAARARRALQEGQGKVSAGQVVHHSPQLMLEGGGP